MRHQYRIDPLLRSDFTNAPKAISYFEKVCGTSKFILIDIGGYFAKIQQQVDNRFSNNFVGCVEDTENGVQKYEATGFLPKPVIHVARSPLKNPEDFLVGQSIVYSVEAILREQGDIIHGRTACVIGYGKIGRSIAGLLHARHVRTVVFDIDPIKQIDALSHGFSVSPSLAYALRNSGIIFCATGNLSLKKEDFALVGDGTYIATVTSSEDELELSPLNQGYQINHISEHVTRYRKKGHYFFVLNRGQAVNFIHGAAVGPFIYLVHAEILVAIGMLLGSNLSGGLHEVNPEVRKKIAEIWYHVFAPKEDTREDMRK
jgi:adenosylhomocysteinase